jgi:hypothetical protein
VDKTQLYDGESCGPGLVSRVVVVLFLDTYHIPSSSSFFPRSFILSLLHPPSLTRFLHTS